MGYVRRSVCLRSDQGSTGSLQRDPAPGGVIAGGGGGTAGALVDPLVAAELTLATRESFVRAALVTNDSAHFCAAQRCALETGPTGTNVADLALWLR